MKIKWNTSTETNIAIIIYSIFKFYLFQVMEGGPVGQYWSA